MQKKYKIFFLVGLLWFSNIVFANKLLPLYTKEQLKISVSVANPRFIIKLASNPTTGFSWSLLHYDHALITPIKHTYERIPDKKLIGAGGFEIWTFEVRSRAFRQGEAINLPFAYLRPWVKKNNPAAQLTFIVMPLKRKLSHYHDNK